MAAETEVAILIKVVNQAAQQLGKLVEDLEEVGGSVTGLNKTAKAGFAEMASTLGTVTSAIGKVSSAIKLLGGGFLAIKAIAFPVHLAAAAGQAEALQQGLEAVGAASGYTAEQLKDAVEQLEKLGITSDTAQQQLNKLITSNVSLQAGTELAASAKKIAATLGKSTDEVFQTLAFSVASGTTRLLRRQFGIVLNEQQIFAEKANKLGRELFTDERRQALAEALNDLAKSQFNATNTTETLAQKQSALKVATNQFEETLGKLLLPALKSAVDLATELTRGMNFLVKSFSDGKDEADKMYTSTTALADSFRTLREVIQSTVDFFKEWGDVITLVAGLMAVRLIPAILNFIGLGVAIRTVAIAFGVAAASGTILSTTLGLLATGAKALLAVLAGTAGLAVLLPAIAAGMYLLLTRTEAGRLAVAKMATALSRFVELLFKAVPLVLDLAKEVGLGIWARITGNKDDAKAAAERFRQRVAEFLQEAKAAAEDIANAQPDKPQAPQGPEFEGPTDAELFERERLAREAAAKAKAEDFERRRRKLEILKATRDAEAKGVEDELALLRARNAGAEQADKALFDQGLLGLEEYYARRRARIQQESDKEIEKAKAALLTAQVNEQLIRFSKSEGSNEAIAARAATESAANALKIAQENQTNQLKANEITLDQQRIANAEKIRDLVIDTRLKSSRSEEAAAIDKVNAKYNDQIKQLKLVDDTKLSEGEKAQKVELEKARAVEITNTRYDFQAKRLAELTATQGQILDAEQNLSNLAAQRGEITETDNRLRQNQIIAQRIALNERTIQQEKDRLVFLRDNGLEESQQYQDGVNRVNGLILANQQLASSYTSLGRTLREDFASSLTTAIDGMIRKTMTAKEALIALAQDVLRSISQAISKELANTVTTALVNVTGGDNGIFGFLGKAISGEMAQKQVQDQLFLEQSALQDSLFLTNQTVVNESYLVQLGTAMAVHVESLLAAFAVHAEMITAANAASNLSFASGGYISGPSHSGGGVNINAEGGEYVVNKRAAKKWGSFLNAINFGDKAPPSGPRTRFAEGGLVPEGGTSNTEINISITDQGVTANGSDGAKQFAQMAGQMVQAELIKQKRPGGMLYNPKTGK